MPQYDDTNSGVLFKNGKKEKETHPDYRGSLNVNGRSFWISAWKKHKQADGELYLSISIEPKQGEQQERRRPQRQQEPEDELY